MPGELSAYDGIEFDDTAQRLPLVLCLDTSSSMSGEPIAALNTALGEWAQMLHTDIALSHSVEIAVVTFGNGGVSVWRGPSVIDPERTVPFASAADFEAPRLTAGGYTPMVAALELAMRIVDTHKRQLRGLGVQYHRPQICLLTDGLPSDDEGRATDDWQSLVPTLTEEQRERRFRLFAIGVGGLSTRGQEVLRGLAPKFNASLSGFPFQDALQMMSNSIRADLRGEGDEAFEKLFQNLTQRRAWE